VVDHVNGISGPGALGPKKITSKVPPDEVPGDSGMKADRVEISEEARLRSQVGSSEGIRMDKVLKVRQELREGTYVTDEKVENAVDKMLRKEFGI